MNIQKMMKEAQRMQEKLAQAQADLGKATVEATVGGGSVKVTANGTGDIVAVKLSREVVDPDDVEMLEDLVLSGIREAQDQAKKMASEQMGRLTGGMSLPGMPF